MGGFEAATPVPVEPKVKYHPGRIEYLTLIRYPDEGPCQRVSLTGAVSSKIVTEEPEGTLNAVGNRVQSVRV